MVAPGSRVLDAGCGPGRVGGALHRWGHEVVGVDADAVLIAAAEADHPGPRWLVADLADGDLAAVLGGAPFDAAVLAGNVLAFVAPGTEAAVLANVAGLVVAGGPVVVGFHVAKLAVERFDVAVADAGLAVESMFSTWDLRAWHAGADFVVAVLRSPGPA
jgi:SAM-dependent methyltransferase